MPACGRESLPVPGEPETAAEGRVNRDFTAISLRLPPAFVNGADFAHRLASYLCAKSSSVWDWSPDLVMA